MTNLVARTRHALGALLAFSSLGALAQTGVISPGSYTDGAEVATDSQPTPKATAGSFFKTLGWYNDQHGLFIEYRSGTSSPQCVWQTVPQWQITITKPDGTLFAGTGGNAWNNVEPQGNACGLIYAVTDSAFPTIGPGTYTVRMAQAGAGADLVGTINVPPCIAALPVYHTRHDGFTDNFYTTSYAQRNESISYGYTAVDTPFRVSPSNYVVQPWKRYFKGEPQIEHFYTHLAAEQQQVIDAGWVYENDEGNIFPTQITGTVPLLRMTKWNPAISDLQHFYTTSAAQVSTYQSQGWTAEGTKGYVCAP